MEWQLIDTAPDYVDCALCWREDAGVFVARYGAPEDFGLDVSELEEMGQDAAETADWFAFGVYGLSRLEGMEAPTHWMPLPPDPQEAKATKHLECNECGEPVTSPVPQSTITTAYLLCPDCLEAIPDDIANQFLEQARKRAKELKEEETQ